MQKHLDGSGTRQVGAGEFGSAGVPGNTPCADPVENAAAAPTPTPTRVPGLIVTPGPLGAPFPVVPTPVVYPENPSVIHCPRGASCPPMIYPGWRLQEQFADDQGLRLSVEGVSVADDRVDIIYSIKRRSPGPEARRAPKDFTVTASGGVDIQMIDSQVLGTLGPTTLGLVSFDHSLIKDDTDFSLHVGSITETFEGADREIDGEWDVQFLSRLRAVRLDGTEGDLVPLQDVYLMLRPQKPDVSQIASSNNGPEQGIVLRMADPDTAATADFYFVADRVNGLRYVSGSDFDAIMSSDCQMLDKPNGDWDCEQAGPSPTP